MVEVEFGARKLVTAVLAGVLVAGKDIKAAEADMTLGHSIIGDK